MLYSNEAPLMRNCIFLGSALLVKTSYSQLLHFKSLGLITQAMKEMV